MNLPKLTLFSLLTFIGSASAATLVNETFSYADGALAGNGGWTRFSPNPPTVPDTLVLTTSGQATIEHGGGSREDVGILLPAVNSGIVLASFDIVVTDDAPISGTDSEYFAHFSTGGTFFRSRVDVIPGSSGGNYSLGIATGGSAAEATLPVDFTFGDTVSVQLGYDFATSTASLTAGGSTIMGDSASAPSQIDAFNLRQSNSTSDETITIDNLVITGTPIPEPSSALLLLPAIGFVTVRRRK